MIEAADFVEAARGQGFVTYAGVPCSFLTPFINYIIGSTGSESVGTDAVSAPRYYSCANEGDAVALVAGAALAGRRGVTMMQNSGLGNAVSPLTSLTWTFRLPQLLIVTWRAQPGVADEPQHQLMGPITPALLETMQIPWERFPQQAADIAPALARARAHMDASGRPYALLMSKGSVAPTALPGSGAPPAPSPGRAQVELKGRRRISRTEALRRLQALTSPAGSVVLGTTGYTGRELYALDDRANQLYMVGSMGCVGALALGLALARPDLTVVAIDGDGAALMRMGLFATIGTYGPPNLVHVLLDNGVHDSTGGQATVSAGVSFAGVAAACGYPLAWESDDPEVLERVFAAGEVAGPRFVRLFTRPGAPAELPRPTVTPEQVRARLMSHIGAA
jgi:phosphonopyruvate decarboxylase